MTTHPNDAQLNELVDGTLPPDEREQVERHAAECVPCTATVRRIEALVGRARSLPREVTAPPEAWVAVRDAVRGSEPVGAGSPRRVQRWPMLAAAAAIAVASVVGTLWLTNGTSAPPATRSTTTQSPAPASLAAFAPIEARYVLAVSALRESLDERREQLDPSTIETVERSLATIDAAIAEARDALANDPANATLTRLLASSYEQKVTLLRRASELPPRS
ncbi:MAG TPA: zf-HC2 domain-containing protein [Gemmatimonadaceae bacterium]|nr:zf-HC2 domain-containing protein [Gemmatimonadaceae bacterium]